MANINKCVYIGNVGKDPIYKTLENGTKIAEFSIATNNHWKDAHGNKQSRTDWHLIKAYGRKAELVEKFLTKGSYIYVETEHRVDKNQYHFFVLNKVLKLDKSSAEVLITSQDDDENQSDESIIDHL